MNGANIPSQQSGARAGQGMCAAQKVKAGDASLCKQLHNNGGLCGMLCTLLPTTLALLHAALVLGTLTKGEGGGRVRGSNSFAPKGTVGVR